MLELIEPLHKPLTVSKEYLILLPVYTTGLKLINSDEHIYEQNIDFTQDENGYLIFNPCTVHPGEVLYMISYLDSEHILRGVEDVCEDEEV